MLFSDDYMKFAKEKDYNIFDMRYFGQSRYFCLSKEHFSKQALLFFTRHNFTNQ